MKKFGVILVLILIFQLVWSPVDPLIRAQTVSETATSTESGTEESTGTVDTSPEATASTSTDPSGGDGSGGGDTTEEPPVDEPEPSLVSCDFFQASPNSITPGDSSTLSWASTGATSAVIDQGIGPVPLSGSLSVNPLVTTSYTLSLTDGIETTSCSATVYAGEEPPDSTDPTDPTDPSDETDPNSGTAETAHLNLNVNVINDNGGTKTDSDFTLTVDGSIVNATAVSGYELLLEPGTYLVSAEPDENYDISIGEDCEANGEVTLLANDIATCSLTFNDIETNTPKPIEDDPSYNQPPVVYWVDEPGFEDGVHPNELNVGETVTAKLIFYDAEGDFADVDLWARGGSYGSLTTDENAPDAYLRDGDTQNGEQLIFSRVVTYSDIYEYYFTVSDYYNDEFRVPDGPAQFIVYDSVENYIPDDGSLIIRDDATGGDCEQIGNWNVVTKTCSLTADLVGKIFIADDGITLDGAGHALNQYSTCSENTNMASRDGMVSSNRVDGITIKNVNFRICNSWAVKAEYSSNWTITDSSFTALDADSFSPGGIYLIDKNFLDLNVGHRIENNTFDIPDGNAVYVVRSDGDIEIRQNRISNTYSGFVLSSLDGPFVISDNEINVLGGQAINVNQSETNELSTIARNTVYDGEGYGFFLKHYNTVVEDNVLTASNQNDNVNIYLHSGSNNIFRRNDVSNVDGGIIIEGDDNEIASNIVEAVQRQSISVKGSRNLVANNTVVDNELDGIYVNGDRNEVVGNTVRNGITGISVYGEHARIQGNQVVGMSGNAIELGDGTDGQILSNSSSGNNGNGIFLDKTIAATIRGNQIIENRQGIVLQGAVDSVITQNTIKNSSSRGIEAEDYRILSTGTVLKHNNFIDNGFVPYWYVSFDDAVAGVTLGTGSGGNYWSQYDSVAEGCTDIDSDDFCDSPFELWSNYNGGVVDLKPYTTANGWLEDGDDDTGPIETLLAPEMPSTLSVSAGGPLLQWIDRSNNEDGFRLWRQVDGGAFSVLTTLRANATEYQDVYVGTEEQCYYVEAYTNNGLLAESDVVCTSVPSSSTLLVPPEPISAGFLPTIDTIVASWRQPADKTDIVGYEIHRSVSGVPYELVFTNDVPYFLDEAPVLDAEHCYIARSYGDNDIYSVFSEPQCDVPYGIGSTIEIIDGPLNVRLTPDGVIAGTQSVGVRGTIIRGPISMAGYIWWEVDFVNAPDGWVAADFIVPVISSSDTGGEVPDDGGTGDPVEPDPVLGCTDPEADNFEEEAEENDGSCIYTDSLPELTFEGLDAEFQDGAHPNKGYADETERTFKVVYKDADGEAPDFVQAVVGSVEEIASPDTDSFYGKFETNSAIYEINSKCLISQNGLLGKGAQVSDSFNCSYLGSDSLGAGDVLVINLKAGAVAGTELNFVLPASSGGLIDRRTIVNVKAFSADGVEVWSGNLVIVANDARVNNDDKIHTETIESVKGVKKIRYEIVRSSNKGVYIGGVKTKPLILDLVPFEPNNPTEDDYKNGVTYLYKTDLPFGDHEFYFTTKNKNMNVPTRIPFGDENLVQSGFDNVAFIPGIKGSRLYLGDDQLWLPSSSLSDDASELWLDASGNSLETDIYTEDVIEKAVYFVDVYGDFAKKMNAFQASNQFEWKAIPYDWRLDYDAIIEDGVQVGNKVYYSNENLSANSPSFVLESIKELRDDSRTGNVKLVAHSMGGLISKRILARLETDDGNLSDYHGLDESISELIMVGSPQVGTPQAIPALLHGYDEGFGFLGADITLTDRQARNVGINAPAAYGLLPSQAYFEQVRNYYNESEAQTYLPTVIEFYQTNISSDKYKIYNQYQEVYKDTESSNYSGIYEYSEFISYLKDGPGFRSERPYELDLPYVVNSDLLDRAQSVHGVAGSLDASAIDDWTPLTDSPINVVQIAGHGNDTLASYFYKYICSKVNFISKTCESSKVKLIPRLTPDGDGVVVTPSASFVKNAKTYYVDLQQKELGEHKDMLGSQPVLELLDYHLFDKSFLLNSGIGDLPDSVSTSSPRESRLYLSVHSPVTIGAYDYAGNYTGLKRNTETGELEMFEEIPDSSYFVAGEGKYLSLPPGQEYRVEMLGTDEGRFMFISEEVKVGQLVESNIVENIPVATATVATLSISPEKADVIEVDVDGNGESDYSVPAFESFNDIQAPTTQIDISGQKVSEKTYLSPVNVTFLSEDVNGVGVQKTEYSFDGENWQDYSGTTTVSEEGEYTIYYRSTDWFGNVEETKSVSFEIVSARGFVEEVSDWAEENGSKQLERMLVTIQDDKYWQDRNSLSKAGGKSVLSRLENAIKFIGEDSDYYTARLELAKQILSQ